MKKLIYFLLIVAVLTITFPAYAQSTSSEVEVDTLFKELYKIFDNDIKIKYDKAIDYSVEILKMKPKSLEASYIICSLYPVVSSGNDYYIKDKFIDYEKKYLSNIEDYSSNIIEKIILAYMMSFGFTSNKNDIPDQDEMQQNAEFGENILLKMKDNIPDENYRAIVLLLLASDEKYCHEFLEKYPGHPYSDSIERNIIFSYFKNQQYEKYIEEVNKLISKYKLKEIITPFGYHGAIDCYSLIVSAYVELEDYKNARLYLDMIKEEAPDYWEIKSLEEELTGVKSGAKKQEKALQKMFIDITEKNKK